MSFFIKLPLIITQKVSSRLIGNKNNYLNSPKEILSGKTVDRIYMLGHFLPSAVLTILIAIKLLPLISADYALQLEENSTTIPIIVLSFLIPILIINGVIIEKSLIRSDDKYRSYVEEDNI